MIKGSSLHSNYENLPYLYLDNRDKKSIVSLKDYMGVLFHNQHFDC